MSSIPVALGVVGGECRLDGVHEGGERREVRGGGGAGIQGRQRRLDTLNHHHETEYLPYKRINVCFRAGPWTALVPRPTVGPLPLLEGSRFAVGLWHISGTFQLLAYFRYNRSDFSC